jgi:hypothetical protein
MSGYFIRAGLMALAITLQLMSGYAQAADVPLPLFSVTDLQGNVVSSVALKQPQPWILIVVAANNQSSRELLSRLQMSQVAWTDRITIIVSGEAAAAEAIKQENDKLSNAHWYRDADDSILANLGLGGLPAILGIVPGDFIAWRSMGVPEAIPDTQSMVASWIDLVVTP